MFMCKHCLEQYEDKDLAYSIIPEIRVNFPGAAESYAVKFCSKAHVQEFLEQIKAHQQKYVLTKHGKGGDKTFEPATALELLLLVGSSKAS